MADSVMIWYDTAQGKVAVMAKRLVFLMVLANVAVFSAWIGIAIGRKQGRELMATEMWHRYGLAKAIFVHRDLKAGDVLTRQDFDMRDYFREGLEDRLICNDEWMTLPGRKMLVDLKRGSVLLKTDVQ